MPEPHNIKYFKTAGELRKWFEKNHNKLTEQWVGLYKKGYESKGVTYLEAVDAALCFGWIDGITKRIDGEKYCQRFTPRKKTSTWSAVNILKVNDLTKKGLMHEAGLKAFNERDRSRTSLYSFEQKEIKLPPAYEKKFKANKKAWGSYQKMPPGYRRISAWWVISAKQEETRLRRLDTLIADSEAGVKIKPLRSS
jgi:uncharacterized protein YdeI (YjbR/CyaY-like superfamily)